MASEGEMLKGLTLRRFAAVLGCLALLYFAAGGAFLHHHSGGADTACHVCQSLHAPVLAAAPLALFQQNQQVTRHVAPAAKASPLDSCALHRASRAPPSA